MFQAMSLPVGARSGQHARVFKQTTRRRPAARLSRKPNSPQLLHRTRPQAPGKPESPPLAHSRKGQRPPVGRRAQKHSWQRKSGLVEVIRLRLTGSARLKTQPLHNTRHHSVSSFPRHGWKLLSHGSVRHAMMARLDGGLSWWECRVSTNQPRRRALTSRCVFPSAENQMIFSIFDGVNVFIASFVNRD